MQNKEEEEEEEGGGGGGGGGEEEEEEEEEEETCTQLMILISLSIEKCVFPCWSGATALPSDFLHSH
jgi:hypothetical protein